MKMHIVKSQIGDFEGFCILNSSGLERMLKGLALAHYPLTFTFKDTKLTFPDLHSLMRCFTLEELKDRTDELLLNIFGDEPYGHFLDIEDIDL